MNLLKNIVLVLFISNSFMLIAQDKSSSNKDKNELTKPSTQEKPLTINSSGLNYVYQAKDSQTAIKNLELIYDINVKDLQTVTYLGNTEKKTFEFNSSKKAESGTLISLGTLNVPDGSVRVTAGNQLLYEGIDYTVNYQAGTVQILDASWAATNKRIRAYIEE